MSALSYAMVARGVWTLSKCAQRNERRAQHDRHWHEGSDCSKAQETLENVDDGVARWTSSLECCFSCNGSSRAANSL